MTSWLAWWRKPACRGLRNTNSGRFWTSFYLRNCCEWDERMVADTHFLTFSDDYQGIVISAYSPVFFKAVVQRHENRNNRNVQVFLSPPPLFLIQEIQLRHRLGSCQGVWDDFVGSRIFIFSFFLFSAVFDEFILESQAVRFSYAKPKTCRKLNVDIHNSFYRFE